MNPPAVSLADLLRALAGLHPAEHAAAAQVVGYVLRQDSATPPPAPAPDLQLPRLQPEPAAAPAAPPKAPQAQASPRHWRVAAVEPVDDQQAPRPAWLQATPAWQDFVSDPAALAPPALNLANPARTAARSEEHTSELQSR